MQMQICHSLVLAVVALGGLAQAAPAGGIYAGADCAPAVLPVACDAGDNITASTVVDTTGCACPVGACGCPARTDVVEPTVTQVAPAIVNQSEDVQPVDIIQPYQDVVQPVVDTHIRPVHSEVVNSPIVQTTTEPCCSAPGACGCGTVAGYGTYAKRQCGCAAPICGCAAPVVQATACDCPTSPCGCPTRVDVVEPTVTQVAPAIVNQSEDVQPVDIIQPYQDVVQPVVDTHIRPVHSEVVNSPIVQTTTEPCCSAPGACGCGTVAGPVAGYAAGYGTYAKRQCGCGASNCACPAPVKVVEVAAPVDRCGCNDAICSCEQVDPCPCRETVCTCEEVVSCDDRIGGADRFSYGSYGGVGADRLSYGSYGGIGADRLSYGSYPTVVGPTTVSTCPCDDVCTCQEIVSCGCVDDCSCDSVIAPVTTVVAAPACGCDAYKAKRQCDCGCPTRANTVQPTVVEVAQPIVHNSQDVQPVQVIQPYQEVVQPIVDEHIQPVHSEVVNSPIVQTTCEPCANAGNGNGYNGVNAVNGNGFIAADNGFVAADNNGYNGDNNGEVIVDTDIQAAGDCVCRK
ncbi:hypothetical protein BZA05DRAFT_440562 [Tricharina praecox]|uniref:uncharacterized protein n=1 Tax=Tricharina praecox TaxID=43433 RepID=UPI00221EBF7B|nr:uncharacterized protein BZA05DRAFT_440562 [Tricharina praecox]KAI5858949.1 hypothetical protein BZA05DRAFT_440562 [Tricharina praecox]